MVQTMPYQNEVRSYRIRSKQSGGGSRRVLNKRGVVALAGTIAALTVVAGGTVALRTIAPHTAISVPVVSVPLTVERGDSLWSLARRYGNPDLSILDRVENLAKANEMTTGAKLVPGQRLLIPVSNPVELARLPQNAAFTTTAQATP